MVWVEGHDRLIVGRVLILASGLLTQFRISQGWIVSWLVGRRLAVATKYFGQLCGRTTTVGVSVGTKPGADPYSDRIVTRVALTKDG